MNCNYFGECGSCTLYNMSYDEQLKIKLQREKERFADLHSEFSIIKSQESNFRTRAEFRIWKNYDEDDKPTLNYAMSGFEKQRVEVHSCEIVSKYIKELMPNLLNNISLSNILSHKFYAIEFLVSSIGDILVTLIYHKNIDDVEWKEEALKLQKDLNIKIIGRSRGKKVVLDVDYINEELPIKDKKFFFRYKEGGFTQPNTDVNIKMIEWVLDNAEFNNDLCELYCGGGNFTIPLSTKFEKVLATEISKTSINSAKVNCQLNNISNIEFIRMSSEEFVSALNKEREFNRLRGINLDSYNFSTIFVDPPRAGLDDTTRDLCSTFKQIIYISCNPETLHRDLSFLIKTHDIITFSFFDQFAYTNHIESGVILKKR